MTDDRSSKEKVPGPQDPRPLGCRCGDMPSPRCPVHLGKWPARRSECTHTPQGALSLFNTMQRSGECLLCERDRLRGELEAAEQHVRILQQQRASLEPCALRDALDAIASPSRVEDYGWWTQVARRALGVATKNETAQPPGEVPSYQAIADQLPAILANGTTQCPLCGKTYPHEHTPDEIVIYRNGVKYGRSLQGTPPEPAPQSIVCRTNDIDETGSGPTKGESL